MAEERGKVLKVMTFDEEGDKIGEHDFSTQIPEDPFAGSYSHGLQVPPLAVEQLIFLAESHPTHAPALDQKTADIIGTGWEWRKKNEDAEPPEGQREQLEEWFESLNDPKEDETAHETLLSAVSDLETVGYGVIELARGKGANNKVEHWYYMPAHTVRFHRSGMKVAQERGGKRVWFKRWLPDDTRQVDKITGKLFEEGEQAPNRANEVLVIRRPARRSSWYGIPTYVSALGWIALSLAARDDNIMFFENKREPRWAVILSNLEDDPDLDEQLRQAFQRDLKQPHRNIFIPISGPGQITFQQLSDNRGDMSFEKLQARADASILLAHKTPPERLGLARTGPLGGNVVESAVRTYKEAVIQTTQAMIAARINRLIVAEGPIRNPAWVWHPNELDLTDANADLDSAGSGFQNGVLKVDEARVKGGLEELEEGDERGDKFWWEVMPGSVVAQQQMDNRAQQLNSEISRLLGDTTGTQQQQPSDQQQQQTS